MATLTVQVIDEDGLDPTLTAAAASGDEFLAGRRTFLWVDAGTGAVVVTIADQTSVSPVGANAFDPDLVVTVPTTEARLIGPLPRARFGDDDLLVQVTYDDETNVTVGAFIIGE